MTLKTYLSEESLKKRVSELAKQLEDYIGDSEAVLVANLKGSVLFYADIIREIGSRNVKLDFISTESYVGTESSGTVKITRDLSTDIRGKKVVLIEDIVDTGLTLDHIIRYIRDIHEPESLRVCVLLDKPANRRVDLSPDYVGYIIEDEFVVGYGLDYDGILRNLPYIAILDLNAENEENIE